MARNRTSIEIEAKGEFSQLTRGLRDVKSALGEVTRVVDTGARSGGFFSDEQIRSMDIFSRRFSDSMERLNGLIDEQSERIVELSRRRRTASQSDIATIDKEMKKHGEYLDALEAERAEIERIYNLRRREAMEFGRKPSRGDRGSGGSSSPGGSPGGGGGASPGGSPGGGGGAAPGGSSSGGKIRGGSPKPLPEPTDPVTAGEGAGLLGLGRMLKGLGGTVATLAGISMTIGQLVKWEQMAEDNVKAWQPLLQRTGMDQAAMTSTGLGRGYNSFETQNMLDIYTQTAGNISQKDAARLMDFSRGYGVDASTAAGIAGQMSVRGYGGAGQVLDMAAGVASSSGMDARILEVLETSAGFLQSMDKNLKDNSGDSLLAYTARINQIGVEKDAQKLTGQSGASILEQMGQNIFNPSNTRWQAMGINLLQRYGGKETSGMNTFDLMSKWQEGFSSPVNMKVLGQYLAEATQGMSAKQSKEYKTLVMQEAMGGGTTVKQAEQFGELTDWLKAFDPSDPRMAQMLRGGNAPGNQSGVAAQSSIDQKVNQWQGTIDAKINIANASWMNAQLAAGQLLIPAKLEIQDFTTDLLSDITKTFQDANVGDILAKQIKDVLGEGFWGAVGTIAGGTIALKIAGAVTKKLGKSFWNLLFPTSKEGGGSPGGGGTKTPPSPTLTDEAKKTPSADTKKTPPSDVRESTPKRTDTYGKDPKTGKPSTGGGAKSFLEKTFGKGLGRFLGVYGEASALSAADDMGGSLSDWFWGHREGETYNPNGKLSFLEGKNPFETDQYTDTRLPIWDRLMGKEPPASSGSGTYVNPSSSFNALQNKFQSTLDALTGTKKTADDTNKSVKTGVSTFVTDGAKSFERMSATTDKNTKELTTKGTSTFEKFRKDSMDLFTKMQTDTADMTKSVTAMTALSDGGEAAKGSGGLSDWFNNFKVNDPSTWFNFGGSPNSNTDSARSARSAGTLPKSEVEKQVYAALDKSGKADWWGTVQKLMSRENQSWDTQAWNPTAIDPKTGKIDPNGEHASGLFQFLPSTFKAHTTSGYKDPRDATVEQQTQALISYVTGKYGDIFSMAQRRGLYTDNYKGYANGTYSVADQLAQIHAGEEIISRAKTGEVQRKTGLLPSQALDRYMSDGGSSGAPAMAATASAGGARRIVVDVNLNGAEALSGLSTAALEQIARQVFEDAAYQAMRQNVSF